MTAEFRRIGATPSCNKTRATQLGVSPAPLWQPTVAVCSASLGELEEENSDWLSRWDAKAAARFRFDKRRHDFLLGRRAAYEAVTTAFPQVPQSSFRIDRGVFEQPIWAAPETGPICLSITHSHGIGVAVASPAGFPMAVDIEPICDARSMTMSTQMTPTETSLAEQFVPQGKSVGLTILWCAKEALSKTIGCGLTCPMHLLEIDEMQRDAPGWHGTYHNFFQYRYQAWFLTKDTIIAIVLHRHYHFRQPENLI